MSVFGYELRKLLRSPILLSLAGLLILLNVLIISSAWYDTSAAERNATTSLVQTHGNALDENWMFDVAADNEERLTAFNETHNTSIASANDQLAQGIDITEPYALELIELAVRDAYVEEAPLIDEEYEQITMTGLAEEAIDQYALEGNQAEWMHNKYAAYSERYEALLHQEEHKTVFYLGQQTHASLYEHVFRYSLIGLSIILTLLTAHSVNYEHAYGTAQHVYSTARGRRLLFTKWLAVNASSFLIITTVLAISLTVFFLTYSFSGMWNTYVSSYFNIDGPLPYLTWWPLTMLTFLIGALIVTYTVLFIIVQMVFFTSVFIRNSYAVFFVVLVVAGGFLLLPLLAPAGSNFLFYGMYTPVTLIMNPHMWFTATAPHTAAKTYEVVTLLVWGAIASIMVTVAFRCFSKQSIH
ncbi:hypothetical protein ACE1TF_06145 [Geomicrobium sp. JSM 1781026]|uniref:hypothetical protein n=1 Tax=Geomicrobium sp. JSM 1781026 TaxID=3344580 RepID=UPI0035C1A85A